jgi:outer membrane immunogenic protein
MPRGYAPVYAPIPTFAGFYLGGHAGYVFDGPQATLFDDGVAAGEAITSRSYRSPSLGVQGGYNFQSGNYLFGIEADWSWATSSRSIALQDAGDPSPDVVRTRLKDFGSVRGRAGFVWDHVLIFGTELLPVR